jgi:glycopeptide antibiotics resistance protein
MLKDTLVEVLNEVWPMLLIFTVIIASVRIAYLLINREKILLYKELLMLLFALYVLIIFYIVTIQENVGGTSNLVPFKEIFRYSFGSPLFFKNIVGNTLLFVPFGLFVSYYLNNHKLFPVFSLTLISSLAIEMTQSKIGRVFDIDDIILNILGGIIGYILFVSLDAIGSHMPRLFHKDWFKNLIIIIILALILFYLLNINTAIFDKIL